MIRIEDLIISQRENLEKILAGFFDKAKLCLTGNANNPQTQNDGFSLEKARIRVNHSDMQVKSVIFRH